MHCDAASVEHDTDASDGHTEDGSADTDDDADALKWLNVLKIEQNQGHVLEARLNFLGWVKIKRSFVINAGESLEVILIISNYELMNIINIINSNILMW